MQYRPFGRSDGRASALGFGAMRLPMKANQIDAPEAIALLREAIDEGVNYIDTAYAYQEGQSEVVVGKALQGGYGARVRLATKLPCWLVNAPADFDPLLNEQLRRLQTDHIDYYLLHALYTSRWEHMQKMEVFRWAEKAVADGRIGALGFSFHDQLSLFKEIVDAYDWGMCQIQYNFMNEEVQAGTAGLEYAAAKGLAVVIMEPLLGGQLANPPARVKAIWEAAQKNPVDMALRWLWNKPEVTTVLSGMSTREQVRQNLASADRCAAGGLAPADLATVAEVSAAYRSLSVIPCTKCRYCLPCPQGIDIPRNLELYNEGMIYENLSLSRSLYTWHMRAPELAKNCVACGECERKCPQQLPISTWMPKVHAALFITEN